MTAIAGKCQCPIRLYRSDYVKIQEKCIHDQITFQKLVEVLVHAYLKDNKEIMVLVKKYADSRSDKRRRFVLDEAESNELLRIIEENHSPLRNLERISEEVKEEDG